MDSLERELARRAVIGLYPVTVAQMNARFAETGYRLDRGDDCRCMARIMSGNGAGDSYPCITTGLTHIATGMRYANVDAPRDDNFRRMMELRSEIFAVTRGAILEV